MSTLKLVSCPMVLWFRTLRVILTTSRSIVTVTVPKASRALALRMLMKTMTPSKSPKEVTSATTCLKFPSVAAMEAPLKTPRSLPVPTMERSGRRIPFQAMILALTKMLTIAAVKETMTTTKRSKRHHAAAA